MISTVRLACAAFLTTALAAQNVLINEVRADADGRWVELCNRSAAPVDLTNWSLHYGSHTIGMPQEYWWPMPAGLVLPAGGYVRVHWFQAAPPAPAPGDYYTGTSPYAFLFGLGGEPLSGVRGAFGLYRTQLADAMSSGTMLEDWISWGEHDFSREPYAVAAGRWSAGRNTPAIAAGTSMARNAATIGVVANIDAQWFADDTPTPLAANITDADVVAYGASCAVTGHHLLGAPVLRTPSLPLVGNSQFRLAIDNTTGIFGEYALLFWSAAAAPAGQVSLLPPTPGGCAESLDTMQIFALMLVPTQAATTNVPLSLATMSPTLVGSQAHAQALVLDLLPYGWLPYQGLSNALRITFGQ